MAELSGSNVQSTNSESGIDELDHVPLTQRRKLLRENRQLLGSADPSPPVLEKGGENKSMPHVGVVFKEEEDGHCNSSQIRCTGVEADVAGQDKLNVKACTLPKSQTLPVAPAKVKVEYFDNLLISSGNGINGLAAADVSVSIAQNEIPGDFVDDDLDHIALKERLRMLLSRKRLESTKPVQKGSSGGLLEILIQQFAEKEKKETHLVEEEPVSENQLCDNVESSASVFCSPLVNGSPDDITVESSVTNQYSWALTKSSDDMEIHASDSKCSSERMLAESNSCESQDCLPANRSSVHTSTSSTVVEVKVEPRDDLNLHITDWNARHNFYCNKLRLKNELELSDQLCGGEVDHKPLRDQMKMPTTLVEDSELNIARNIECLKKSVPSALGSSFIAPESTEPLCINRPRKRRKTATDSVETALEEDAPGLLKVLVDKGISVDEIKLYGEMENDEALDESFSEDSFAELEDVMSKIFSQRESCLKFAPIRCAKGARSSYCLACLFSLVEQTRYLQFRKWPVEWGWCRDLQSFIFVFKRHNRIVLERPEYGYATYFFEIVDSLPTDWQIKRLVTAMKLSNCGRLSVIENKALVVGEDLTKAEAQVLMEYGWVPNSGLGTMLNYCDRVVHDRKNEKDSSEWKSKIAKLLMDGYNGGSLVATNIPKKVEEYIGSQNPEIKLEF
ncbi:hypothetical protein F2P56_000795 [Juglans regia]|uniref:Uncharacterized protein n=2 Tax=Juglans regia TaxID=51240 RepID=A0A833YCH4_JUGRE|nr:uncharacterized protein LOC108988165 isoform X2 [Juglans regia]KAF5480019.1 hypothetical protein F2P56_000795 [Juglans regia]